MPNAMIDRYQITDFGPEEDGWDAGETCLPGIGIFANALQVWALCQADPVTVDTAAAGFNVPHEMIRRAVEHHYWMFLDGDNIEHEGE